MLKNYLTIALRTLTRNRLYTSISIASLSVGIAGCILIMLFVQHEWSFDKFHQNTDRIFRVIGTQKSGAGERIFSAFQPFPLAPALLAEFPEIESAVRILQESGTVTYGEQPYRETLTFADPAFLTMFSFPLVAGNPPTALASPNAIVITSKMAHKYFGNDNPIGKRLIITLGKKAEDFEVTALAAPAPENSSIQFDFLLPATKDMRYERNREKWSSFNGSTYVMLARGAQISALESRLYSFAKKYFGKMIAAGRLMSQDEDAIQLWFQPFTKAYLDPEIKWSQEQKGDPKHSYILSGMALLVLLIACINFMTLAAGHSTCRAKEVGVRKVLGAVRFQLMKQFWGETLLLCALALLLGIVLAELLLPTFNQLAAKNLRWDYLSNSSALLALVGLLLFVAMVAGSYPAAFLSQFQAVEVLKGKLRLGDRSLFARSLVILQFGLSIFLITGALIMWKQLDFLRARKLGYDPEHVIVIPTFNGDGNKGEESLELYRQKLAAYPSIINVTGASAAFTRGFSQESFEYEGVNHVVYVYRVDPNYLQTLGIELVEGRNFIKERRTDAKDAVIVNEALVQELGWQAPVAGRRLTGWNTEPTVIGEVKDHHYLSLHQKIEPMILILDPDFLPFSDIMVRISSENIPATIELLRKTWKEVAPDTPFEFCFLDENVQNQYQTEERWGKIVACSSVLGILLACLGLFGLATLSATSRTKEIGIRKVLGASVSSIASLLSNEFVRLVLMANLIAWPVAYFAMNKWLQDFAYRIKIGIWTFLLAGALALIIAWLTVSYQAIKAASANPVEALRYE